MKLSVAAAGLLFPSVILSQTSGVPEIPVQTFFRTPELTQMRLAPDGKFLAAIAHQHGKRLLFGINLETGERKAIILGDIYAFFWVANERLLFYDGAVGRGGLFAVNRDGSKPLVLQRPYSLQIDSPNFRYQLIHVLAVPQDKSDCVLLERAEWNPRGRPEVAHPDVRRVNFLTGNTSLEEKNPGNVIHWLADGSGIVRVAVALEKETEKVLYRRAKGDPWKTISVAGPDQDEIRPLGFAPGDNVLYVATRGVQDTRGLYLYDAERCQLGQRLWHNERFDFVAPRWKRSQVAGVFYDSNRPQVEWFDESRRSLQAQVDSALPQTVNWLVNSSRDGTRHLFRASSDRSPGSYYLINTRSNEFGIIGHVSPWIDPELMSQMRPIQYQSRDGLTIHGYLSLPVGHPGKNLPLIVVPHGGPWSHDRWGFQPEVQFFANRGYAVLQMNFRGSTGHGLAFLRAGFKEWGRKMQDDITDGVQWAVGEGIADRNRIAIFGASYGGYAALMGLASTPGLYKCGIDYLGVTDLATFLKQRALRTPRQFETMDLEQIGNFREQIPELEAVSPLHLVDKIQAPILLAYGGKDPVVEIDQGKKLAKALAKAGKKFELLIEPDEGHGFSNETNRFKLFDKIAAFLKTHL